MLQPALLLCVIQRTGKIACAVIKQQLLNALIDKGNIQRGQVTRLGFEYDFHGCAIGIAEKTIIELGINVIRGGKRFGFGENRHHFVADLRVFTQHFQVIQAMLAVNSQPVGILRAQGIRLRQYRTFIDMHQLYRHCGVIAKIGFGRIKPLAKGVAVQLKQRRNIAC